MTGWRNDWSLIQDKRFGLKMWIYFKLIAYVATISCLCCQTSYLWQREIWLILMFKENHTTFVIKQKKKIHEFSKAQHSGEEFDMWGDKRHVESSRNISGYFNRLSVKRLVCTIVNLQKTLNPSLQRRSPGGLSKAKEGEWHLSHWLVLSRTFSWPQFAAWFKVTVESSVFLTAYYTNSGSAARPVKRTAHDLSSLIKNVFKQILRHLWNPNIMGNLFSMCPSSLVFVKCSQVDYKAIFLS